MTFTAHCGGSRQAGNYPTFLIRAACAEIRIRAFDLQLRRTVGDRRYRTWQLYLAGSAYYFQKARLGLYQTVLSKNESEEILDQEKPS